MCVRKQMHIFHHTLLVLVVWLWKSCAAFLLWQQWHQKKRSKFSSSHHKIDSYFYLSAIHKMDPKQVCQAVTCKKDACDCQPHIIFLSFALDAVGERAQVVQIKMDGLCSKKAETERTYLIWAIWYATLLDKLIESELFGGNTPTDEWNKWPENMLINWIRPSLVSSLQFLWHECSARLQTVWEYYWTRKATVHFLEVINILMLVLWTMWAHFFFFSSSCRLS